MNNPIFKKIELVGTSKVGVEDAIANAIRHATAENHKVDWFEIVETRGAVKDGQITQFQVVVRVGVRVAE